MKRNNLAYFAKAPIKERKTFITSQRFCPLIKLTLNAGLTCKQKLGFFVASTNFGKAFTKTSYHHHLKGSFTLAKFASSKKSATETVAKLDQDSLGDVTQ